MHTWFTAKSGAETVKLIIFHPCDYSLPKLRMCTRSQGCHPQDKYGAVWFSDSSTSRNDCDFPIAHSPKTEASAPAAAAAFSTLYIVFIYTLEEPPQQLPPSLHLCLHFQKTRSFSSHWNEFMLSDRRPLFDSQWSHQLEHEGDAGRVLTLSSHYLSFTSSQHPFS